MLKKWLLRLALLGIGAVFFLYSFLVTVQIVTASKLDYPFEIITLALAAYSVTICVWVALYALHRILNTIEQHQVFAPQTLRYVSSIRNAVLIASFASLLSLPFFYRITQLEDAPGLLLLGIAFIFIPFALAILMQIVEDLFKSAIALQTENDLTV